MSVKVMQPADGSLAEVVRVASDASDNYQAIADIDGWAADHGYSRSNEQWLSSLVRDGQKFFLGTCYRTTAEDLRTREERIRSRAALRQEFANV